MPMYEFRCLNQHSTAQHGRWLNTARKDWGYFNGESLTRHSIWRHSEIEDDDDDHLDHLYDAA